MSFKRFDQEDITISAESITSPTWTGQTAVLTGFYTGSQTIVGSGQYYYDIYQQLPGTTGAEVQFSIGYGNRVGSGSLLISANEDGKSPSSVVYGQYRTLINGDENTDFTFAGSTVPDSVYIITVNRSRYKEKLLPGGFNLTLTSGSRTIELTDNSQDLTTVSYTDSGRIYEIVTGSNGIEGTGLNTAFKNKSGSYGYFLPDVGIAVLNGNALKDATYGIKLRVDESSNTQTTNLGDFYNAIKAGSEFELRSEETITSNYVFVRVRNSEFNYSTNPSNITGSGELRHTIMVNTPQSYITTVGLYNDNNDLLGVAKLSRPLLKDFTKEALIRIKLDY